MEASTDGFTDSWAGGQIASVHDAKMGWGAGGLYVQHFTLNVGCAFFRPTERALELLRRVAERLSAAAAWDQQVMYVCMHVCMGSQQLPPGISR